jgi:hypothetical protein
VPAQAALGRTVHGEEGSRKRGGRAADDRAARVVRAHGHFTRHAGGLVGASASGRPAVGRAAGAKLDRGGVLDPRRRVVAALRSGRAGQGSAVADIAQRAGVMCFVRWRSGCRRLDRGVGERNRSGSGRVLRVAACRHLMRGRQVHGRMGPAAQGQQGEQQPDHQHRAGTHVRCHGGRITHPGCRVPGRPQRPRRGRRHSFLQ